MCLGIPGEILSVSGENPLTRSAKVSFGGVTRDICLAYAPEASVGDFVIVHVGFAISVIDRQAAERVQQTLRELEASGNEISE